MLAPEDEETLNRLRREAFNRIMEGTDLSMTALARSTPPKMVDAVYEAWLSGKPPQIVLFCRLMASAHTLCAAGMVDVARTQIIIDLTTNRVPVVSRFVDRMPEILKMIKDATNDNATLTHTLFVLSHFLPKA